MLDGKHKLNWKWGHIVSYVAHQYSRVDFYSSLEVNLSLYYGGVETLMGSSKWNGNENDHGQMRGWFSEPLVGSCLAFQTV